jgi:hypothetical protein
MSQSNSPSRRTHRQLTLVLPQLLDAGPALTASLQERAPALPGLERLLARGRWQPSDSVLPLIDESGLAPAPLALLGEGEGPGDAYWLRADPVHLRPDQDRLMLWDSAALSLSMEEAEALVVTFNDHFADDGYRLRAKAPGRWYLRSDQALQVDTTSVTAVSGKNPFHFMPAGPDRAVLEQLINEAQMLFHDHPVNRRRQAEGQLAVIGVWPWGGGKFEEYERNTMRFERVLAHEPLYRGLGQVSGCPVDLPPVDFAAWCRESTRGHELLVLDQGSDAARLGDEEAWHAALAQLERDWWAPVASALWRGRLAGLCLQAGSGGTLVIDPRGMRCVWRRPRSLAAWLDTRNGARA